MKLTPEEKLQRQRDKRLESARNQQAKQRARLADPEYRAEQREKAMASANRQRTRQIERLNSPEYREKRAETLRKKAEHIAAKQPQPARRKSSTSRGTKGRTPTAEERRIMDALGKLPCIACYMHGVITEVVALHHIDGRTKPGAHKKVLPLCDCHHQGAAPAEVRAECPWLVPVHANGNLGGKAAFSRLNKPELALLVDAYALAGLSC